MKTQKLILVVMCVVAMASCQCEKKESVDGKMITMYDYMVQNTDADKVFFQLDVYWSNMGRRAPVELFEEYPGRFEVLHIKDSKELGRSGFVGFDAIFKNLDLAKTKYLIVEVERYNIPPIESVKESFEYLDKADFVKANYPEKSIGLQMYSLRGPIADEAIGIETVITAVGEMGYKYVENFGYNESDGSTYGLSPEDLKAKLEAVGVYILSTHVSKGLPSVKTEENMANIWAWWDKCIADHKTMGAKYIVVSSMETPETLARLQEYCDYYNALGEKCLEAGLKFGYHNHSFEFEKFGGQTGLDILFGNTSPKSLQAELDLAWVARGYQDPTTWTSRMKGRMDQVHFKDTTIIKGETKWMSIGQGNLDWKAIIAACKKIGVQDVIVEQDGDWINNDPFKALEISYKFLSGLGLK